MLNFSSKSQIREENCVIWLNNFERSAAVFYLTAEGTRWKIPSHVFCTCSLWTRSIPLATNSQSLSVGMRVCPRINFPVYSPCRDVGVHKMCAFASSSLWPCVQICGTACMCIHCHGHLQPVIIPSSISLVDRLALSAVLNGGTGFYLGSGRWSYKTR